MLHRLSLRQFRMRPVRPMLVAAGVVLGGGFSAHAALVVIEQARLRAEAEAGTTLAPPRPTLAPATAHAAPARGATGTIALPDLPPPPAARALAGDLSVKPAAPFSLAGASAQARGRAQQCLTAAIYYEAASESEAGQRAVAQVVLNRVRHPAFPNSVCGVVYQGSERGSGCQFSFACDGSMARAPSRTGWARAARYAADALTGRVVREVGAATHYHTYAVNPAWNKSLVMTAAIGAHFFQRWKGGWGTPAAFHQLYAAVEPFPGPRAPIAPSIAPQLAALALPVPTTPSADQPARPGSDPDRTAAPQSSPAPAPLPETTMLDKWAGTGQPLK